MTAALLFVAAVLPCRPVAGSRIHGSDLAAAVPALAAIPAEAVIGYSPRPGARRVFLPEELARLAEKYGAAPAGETLPEVCFESAASPLDAGRVTDAMRRSLGLPDARIDIVELSRYPAPPGEIVFPREWLTEPASGQTTVWNGYVQYAGGRFTIWARVRIAARERRVVATADLRPGHAIAADQVRIEEVDEFPHRTPPVSTLADAVGWLPRRTIPAGSPLAASALEAPHLVEKGEPVAVVVRSGAAILKMDGTAESAGRLGDIVAVRNPSSGKLFKARVEDRGRVVVKCDTEADR